MRNLNYLNDKRIDLYGCIGDEYNGAFKLRINGTFVNVIASRGMGWEHVSVSQPSKTPSWEIMAKVKEMFFEEEEVVIQYHPKKSEYINNHKHCLHLWRPIDKEIITPPTWMIGFKEMN